jgi:hypothetical protein
MPRRKITKPINGAGELPKLTRKQQLFVLAIIAGKSDLVAYREAYNSHTTHDNTVLVATWRLRRNTKIAQWIRRAQALAVERGGYGIVEGMDELSHATEIAFATGNVGAGVAAIIAKLKLAGLLVERHGHTIHVPLGELIAQGFRLMGPAFDKSPLYRDLTKRIEPSDAATVAEVHRSPQRSLAEPNCGVEGIGHGAGEHGGEGQVVRGDPQDVDFEAADNRRHRVTY